MLYKNQDIYGVLFACCKVCQLYLDLFKKIEKKNKRNETFLPLDRSPVLDVKSKKILRIADGYFLVMKCINLSKDFKEICFWLLLPK